MKSAITAPRMRKSGAIMPHLCETKNGLLLSARLQEHRSPGDLSCPTNVEVFICLENDLERLQGFGIADFLKLANGREPDFRLAVAKPRNMVMDNLLDSTHYGDPLPFVGRLIQYNLESHFGRTILL